MNRHLVTVKVCVKGSTAERVQLDRPALYQNGRKRLNTQSVKGRRTVKEYGVILDYIFKNVPNLVVGAVYHLSCALYIACLAPFNQFLHYKGLKQLNSHFLGQSALIHS